METGGVSVMDPTFQFQMAFIDWDKYKGPFRNLSTYPEQWANCVFTMCGDFSRKDLLKAVPQNGPWDAINEIKQALPLAEAKVRGQSIDAAAIARITARCDEFTHWANWYFANTTPPWQRKRPSSGNNSSSSKNSGCGGCLLTIVILIAIVAVIGFVTSK